MLKVNKTKVRIKRSCWPGDTCKIYIDIDADGQYQHLVGTINYEQVSCILGPHAYLGINKSDIYSIELAVEPVEKSTYKCGYCGLQHPHSALNCPNISTSSKQECEHLSCSRKRFNGAHDETGIKHFEFTDDWFCDECGEKVKLVNVILSKTFNELEKGIDKLNKSMKKQLDMNCLFAEKIDKLNRSFRKNI